MDCASRSGRSSGRGCCCSRSRWWAAGPSRSPGQPPTDAGFPVPNLLPGWHMLFTATQRQDAAWFLRLATSGYAHGDGSAAFFPLYPLGVRLVASLPALGPLGAALIVSNAAFLGALIMVHALTRLELGAAAARRTVLFGAFFPTAFFLLAPYTEPLFLLLSIAAFWFARRDRWIWAMVAGAGAAATRSIGALLIVALAVEALVQWRDGRPLLPRLGAASGSRWDPSRISPIGRFGSGTSGRRSTRNATGSASPRSRSPPCRHAVKLAWLYQTWWLIDVIVVGIAIAGILVAAFRVPLTYTVYAGMSVLIPLTFTYEQRPLTSMPRFMAVVFPRGGGSPSPRSAGGPPRRPSWSPSRAASRCSPTCSSTGSPSSRSWTARLPLKPFRIAATRGGRAPLDFLRPMEEPVTIRVAIADDHSLVRQGLRRYLDMADGIEVVGEASNGKELLELIGNENPDIALIDIRMPEMDGLEAAREIRDQHPKVGVIMLTAYDDRQFVVEAVRSGARGYVLKARDAEHLIQTVRLVAGGNMVIDPQLVVALAEELSTAKERDRKAETLTAREIEVLQLLAFGHTNRDIAERLYISPDTVKTHLEHIFEKLGASDRTAAVAEALRRRLIE